MGSDPRRLLAIVHAQNALAAVGLDLGAVLAVLVASAKELTGASGASVEIVDQQDKVVRAAADSAVVQVGVELDAGTLSGQCYIAERTIRIDAERNSSGAAYDALLRAGARAAISSPLTAGANTIGALTVFAPTPDAFEDTDEETVGMLARFATHQILQAQHFQESERLGRRDPLTGLGNRRALDECLRTELARHARYGRALSLCLIDLDGFKSVNDSLGHQEGDRVLVRVAQRMCEIRGADGAFRFGGDEFAIVLPETALEAAELVARRLARTIRDDVFPAAVSASWGVAEADGTDPAALIERADAALYARKRSDTPNAASN
jgi:diguanylate cyclase (GGDEF)-like protein